MLKVLYIILAFVIIGLLFYAGYAFGHREVDALKLQIIKLKTVGDTAEAQRRLHQAAIEKELRDKAVNQTRELAALKADAKRREDKLGAALADSKRRINVLQSRVAASRVQRERLEADMTKASVAERKKLHDKINLLDRENRDMIGKVDANLCLNLLVPDAVIRPLLQR